MGALKGRKDSSFLKKRSKKLLSVSAGTGAPWLGHRLAAIGKSFLLLFFKKEVLPFFFAASTHAADLRCAVIAERDDWNKADQHGDASTFETKICRAIGARIITIYPEEGAGLAALHSARTDLVVGVTPDKSATYQNDLVFGPVLYRDEIAILGNKSGLICAAEGSSAEAAASRVATVFSFQEEGEMESALLAGKCSGLAATLSRIAEIKSRFPAQLAHMPVSTESLGSVPMSVAYRRRDVALGALVDATLRQRP